MVSPRQHLFLSDFLILAILMGLKWYCFEALICISLTNNFLHVYLCIFGEVSFQVCA